MIWGTSSNTRCMLLISVINRASILTNSNCLANDLSSHVRHTFPEPVRPTTPTRWPPSNVHVMPFRTRGAPGLYRICVGVHPKGQQLPPMSYIVCSTDIGIMIIHVGMYTCKFCSSTLPSMGQFGDGRLPSMMAGLSLLILMYCCTRSTETMLFAN